MILTAQMRHSQQEAQEKSKSDRKKVRKYSQNSIQGLFGIFKSLLVNAES